MTSFEKIRVGLVEDHPVFREGLRAVFQSDPRLVLIGEAGDHEQGVKLAQEGRPDVLVMDISLRRGPNGIAVTRLLTEEQPSVRILVLSVEDGADYVRGAYEAGARGYVLKDDPSPKLLAAIHAVASGGTFWPPGVNLGTTRGALTPTQLEVARLVAAGLQSKEIADELGNSVRTVESHRAAIRERTHTSNVIEVRAWLEARGLLDDTADRCPSR